MEEVLNGVLEGVACVAWSTNDVKDNLRGGGEYRVDNAGINLAPLVDALGRIGDRT